MHLYILHKPQHPGLDASRLFSLLSKYTRSSFWDFVLLQENGNGTPRAKRGIQQPRLSIVIQVSGCGFLLQEVEAIELRAKV